MFEFDLVAGTRPSGKYREHGHFPQQYLVSLQKLVAHESPTEARDGVLKAYGHFGPPKALEAPYPYLAGTWRGNRLP